MWITTSRENIGTENAVSAVPLTERMTYKAGCGASWLQCSVFGKWRVEAVARHRRGDIYHEGVLDRWQSTAMASVKVAVRVRPLNQRWVRRIMGCWRWMWSVVCCCVAAVSCGWPASVMTPARGWHKAQHWECAHNTGLQDTPCDPFRY